MLRELTSLAGRPLMVRYQAERLLEGHDGGLEVAEDVSFIYPGDILQVIGNDTQLATFGKVLEREVVEEDYDLEKREMKLRRMVIEGDSKFVGKTLAQSGIRHIYNCMVVGLEEGLENLSQVKPSYVFEKGDIIWVVGEEDDLNRLMT